MSNKLASLYELCLERTARLLKDTYWNVQVTLEHNPFCMLPSVIIDELIIRVVQISGDKPIVSSDLQLLLRSGRVRQFTLDSYGVDDGTFHGFLIDLTFSSVYLTSVKISVYCDQEEYEERIECALNHLLSKAPNLRFLESNVKFDLAVLCNVVHLEKLILNFKVDHLTDFLKVNGCFKQNTSLKCLGAVFVRDPTSMLADVLKYCTELISIKYNITETLAILHAEEFRAGTLSPKYKIEECTLGSSQFGVASEEDILIASVTCPNVNNLVVRTHAKDISNLSHFHKLRKLRMTVSYDPGLRIDFIHIQALLAIPEFGYGLTHLQFNCIVVDFSAIGACCPNLQELIVKCHFDMSQKIIPSSFQNLHKLVIAFKAGMEDETLLELLSNGINLEEFGLISTIEQTLVGILSNAINLQVFGLSSTEKFTDRALNTILRKNSLLHLEHLSFVFCDLSLDVIRTLASRLTSLKFIDILGSYYDDDTIGAVFRTINPHVIMDSSDDTPGKSKVFTWL